jgi:hypothetical protein
MIVDAHTHVVVEGHYPEAWWAGLADLFARHFQALGRDVSPAAVRENILPRFFDPEGERLLQSMEEAGIDVSVLLPLDYGLALGDPADSLADQCRWLGALQEKYPKRLVAFTTVDPRRRGAAEFVRRSVEEWGLRGLKLHPGAGFYPNSRESYRVMEAAAECKLAVVVHTGQIVYPLKSKFCDPIYLDDILVDFPELKVQAAHLGFGWRDGLNQMGATKPNLFTDFAGWQRMATGGGESFIRALRDALDHFGPARVFFGTDGPYLRVLMKDLDFIRLLKNLPAQSPHGIGFSEDEIRWVLGDAAANFLGLLDVG